MSFIRFFIILICFYNSIINAHWLNAQEAPLAISEKHNIIVANDGSYDDYVEVEQTILNEAGREKAATIEIIYDADFPISNIRGATHIGKLIYPVNNDTIEDKPLASEKNGFSNKKQTLIAFPKVQIGATIKYQYHIKVNKLLFNHFEFFKQLFDNNYRYFQLNIRSDLSLNLSYNDPFHALQVNRSKNGKNIQIKLVHPLCLIPKSKIENNIFSYEQTPWISLSSIKNWAEYIQKIYPFWQKIYTEKLPNSLQRIYKEATLAKTEEQQITLVIMRLIEKIRYMGDWRSSEAWYFPRSLQLIAKTGFGDCKDFSAATIAILAKLGFETYPAFTCRGTNVPKLPINIQPSLFFDHAIVWAKGKSGKIYWLDPTNIVSTANEIFPDIADRHALVLHPTEKFLQKIPAINYQKAQQILERHWQIINQQNLRETGTLKLLGVRAIVTCQSLMFATPFQLKEAFFHLIANNESLDETQQHSVQLPELKSPLVQDLTIPYQISRQLPLWKTNHGPALLIDFPSIISNIITINKSIFCDHLLSEYPTTIKQLTEIQNITVTNINSLNYEVKSPWLTLKRTSTFLKGTLRVEDEIVIYKNYITNTELHSTAFKKLQDELRSHSRELVEYRQF